MSATGESAAFDRGIDPVFRVLSAEQARLLVELQADESLQARIAELAEKSTEDELTPDERAEYEGYVKANKFVAVVQAKARKLLSRAGE
jgi:hypothetical protein